MKHLKGKLIHALVMHFEKDYKRIEHAVNVLQEAEKLALQQPVDYEILIASALFHDIGIKIAEEKYGYNNGAMQEEYGPPLARQILNDCHIEEHKIQLNDCHIEEHKIQKICNIIGNHHSSSKYPYPELKTLKKADAIVNKAELAEDP